MKELSKRERIDFEVADLKYQRTSYEQQWMDVSEFLLPYRLRLNLSDYNRGDRRNTRIYDSTAIICARTLESGLCSAATDPAGQWFKFTTKDPERAEFGPHREWLDYASELVMGVFADSNIYIALANLYKDMAGFGTGCFSIEEDFRGKTIHTRSFAPGSYWLGQDDQGHCNVFYREFRMTIRQLYAQFGDDADYSMFVKDQMELSRWETWVDVAHLVWPNEDYKRRDPRSKPWASCWFELNTREEKGGKDKMLKEGGFDSFPFMVGRWEQQEGEIYGIDCPGMTAMGDVKALQIGERRKFQFLEKGINPHFVGSPELKGRDHGFLPGQVTYIEERGGNGMSQRLRPLHDVNPGWLTPLENIQMQTRERIQKAYYYDLFSLFDSIPDKQRTATEIMERKGEKLIKLVKMYVNLTISVLGPTIDRTLEILHRQGMLPPAPPDLQGHELEYEYQGVLSQAQKMLRVQPIERVLGIVGQMAAIKPDVLDKIDLEQCVDEIATSLSVPATIINSDEKMEAIRQNRAAAQQQAAQLQAAEQVSQTAKNLSEADTSGENALTKVMDSLGVA